MQKIKKCFSFIFENIILSDKRVNMKAKIIDMIYKNRFEEVLNKLMPSSKIDNNDEPKLIGISSKKENSFPLSLLSLDTLLPKRVIPLLETPGKTLKH